MPTVQKNKVRLNFRVGASEDKTRWYIDDIPDDQWEKFTDRAKQLMPEKGDKAWASLIAEVIASLLDGSTDIMLMTDIPRSASEFVAESLSQIKMTPDKFFATLYENALRSKFHVLKFQHSDGHEKSNMVVLIDLPDKVLEELDKVGKQVDNQSGLSILGLTLHEIYKGNMTYDIKVT